MPLVFSLTLRGAKFESQLFLMTLDRSRNLSETELFITKRGKRQPVLTASQDHYGNGMIRVKVLFQL